MGDAAQRHRDDSASVDLPAPTIAGYVIEEELGRGAMGVVYRGRQVRLNRPCALKLILAGAHADPVAAVRFLGEAEAVARIQHPNIVQIHAVGDAGGLPFLELEYLPGGSLDRTLDGTPWPARRAAALVEALARGVAEAHRLQIIHRDLKPSNILIAADGTPKIADFGLAKSLDVESGLTATDSILGTPSYMAPEQAQGKAKEVGPLADVHALGAILYGLLVGRPPFRGATVLETLEQVKSTEPVPPLAARAGRGARRRDHRLEVPAEGTGQAVRIGDRPGRRPAKIPGGRADKGPTGRVARTHLALVPSSPGPGRRDRDCGDRDRARRGHVPPLRRPSASLRDRTGCGHQANHQARGRPRHRARSPRRVPEGVQPAARGAAHRAWPGRLREGPHGPGLLWTLEGWRAASEADDPAWRRAAPREPICPPGPASSPN